MSLRSSFDWLSCEHDRISLRVQALGVRRCPRLICWSGLATIHALASSTLYHQRCEVGEIVRDEVGKSPCQRKPQNVPYSINLLDRLCIRVTWPLSQAASSKFERLGSFQYSNVVPLPPNHLHSHREHAFTITRRGPSTRDIEGGMS